MSDAGGLAEVQAYYGRILGGAQDLKTGACRCNESIPAHHRAVLAEIDAEIRERSYGCGAPIPPALEGCTVLDLGCGTGRDAYLASALAGPGGRVIGVDMTEAQLAVARRHRAAQAQRFGHAASNVEFRHGCIEDLGALGIADASVDVAISNCVINLSPAKQRIFAEIVRVLKPGGELLFADIFADRRLPPELLEDAVLRNECLAGAMYVEDFRRLMQRVGWPDHRIVASRPVDLGNPEVEAKVGGIGFQSMTVRAFKLDGLEDACEDYGQVAWYLGSIPGHAHRFALDDHHVFVAGKPMPVCGNTAAMLSETRLARHFKVLGDRSTHFGRFDCTSPGLKGRGSGGECCQAACTTVVHLC